MDWKIFWEKKGQETDTLTQVARISNQTTINQIQHQQQAQHVANCLNLNGTQTLLDVCCGNGFFTELIGKHAKTVVGIDFSESLLNQAKLAYPNIRFEQANALQLTQWPAYNQYLGSFDVITICFSFQYFDTVEKGNTVIQNLVPLLKPSGKILITDVPDTAQFFRFYNTIGSLFRLMIQMAKNKNLMGKFWAQDELMVIAKQNGLLGQKIIQPSTLPYSQYRMDFLWIKP